MFTGKSMRWVAVGAVMLGGSLVASTALAAAGPFIREARPSSNVTLLPLSSAAPTVRVDATPAPVATTNAAASKPKPAYSYEDGANGASGVATTEVAGTSVAYYEGEGCDSSIFDIGDDDDDGNNGGNVITTPDAPKSDDDDDDDDDTNGDDTKKSDDDDDDTSSGSSSSSSSGSSGSSDSTEHTLDVKVKVHGTHAQNVPHKHERSPVSRFALLGVALAIPLRRKRWKL